MGRPTSERRPSSHPRHRVAKNTLLLLAQHGFVTVAGIAVAAFIAQRLGPDHYGLFEYAFAFAGGFSLLSTFGLRAVTVRGVAQGEATPGIYLGRTLTLRVALAALALPLLFALSALMHDDRAQIIAVAIAAATIPIDAASTAIRDVFQGLERFDVEAATGIAARIATLVGAVAVLVAGHGVLAVVGVYAGGAVVRAAVPVFAARRANLSLRPRLDVVDAKQQLTKALPFAGTAFVGLLLWEINPILLGEIGDLAMVGIFAAGAKLMLPLEVVPDSLASALAPAVARGWAENDPETEPLLRDSFFVLAVLGLPVGVGGVLTADLLIDLLFGPSYAAAAPVMKLLFATMPLEFSSIAAYYVLGAIHEQRRVFLVTGAGAAVNVGLASWLIPTEGAFGCALATFAAVVTCFVGAHVTLARHYRVWSGASAYVKLIAANAIMAASVLAVRSWGALPSVTVGVVVYASLVTAMRLVSWREVRSLISRQRRGNEGESA
ncbi:MAG: oligosaccharide flippase family protein [Polyangiaceae bacterium]